MGAGTATQLITVVATLSGVVLTLIANAYLERCRAQDARELESLHLSMPQALILSARFARNSPSGSWTSDYHSYEIGSWVAQPFAWGDVGELSYRIG
jgi:hypothetical protein